MTHLNLSVVYDYLKRPKEALGADRRALEIEPRNSKAFALSCELELVLKQNKEAADCYESLQELTSLGGRSQAYYGLALMRTKKLNRAIPILEEAVRLLPNHTFAYNLLGAALLKKGRYKNAVAVFKRALEINPENEEIRYNLAQTQLKAGNKAAALVQYKVIEGKNPALARELYKSIYSDKVIFVEKK